MALVPMEYDDKVRNGVTITPTTNSYYSIVASKSVSISNVHTLSFDISCTTPDLNDWREFATIDKTSADDYFVNFSSYGGNASGISLRVGGNKVYAFSGEAGKRYRGQIMFYSNN